jgi:hypothetical protein
MSLAILDNLQTLDGEAKSAFADDSAFIKAQEFVRLNLNSNSLSNLDAGALTSNIDQVTQSIASGGGAIPQAPFSTKELHVNITSKLNGLSGLNLESLQQSIPSNPGQSSFQGLPITTETNQVISNLTAGITGNQSLGQLDLPTSGNNPFGEFQEFLNQAGALPSKVLDAVLKALKKLLDKVANPDAWLSDLSGSALTEIFIDQIQDITNQLPHVAIYQVSQSLDRRTAIMTELNKWMGDLAWTELKREQFPDLRKKVKGWIAETDQGDQQIEAALSHLTSFDWTAFQKVLSQIADSSEGDKAATLSTVFEGVQSFLDSLNGRIEDVTEQLKAFIDKIQALIKGAIDKVGEVANTITTTIAKQIDAAGQALDKVVVYLKEAIAKLTAFVDEACNKSEQIVQPLKTAFNQFAEKAVTGIEKLAKTVKAQTEKLQTGIENVNDNIVAKLNREELEKKIRELLSKVTNVLESPAVNEALKQSEAGIDQIVEALKKVSLDPAFKLAVTKTEGLETKLKQINVANLGTAQKAALKVGVKILQQVDVPGTVNPELTAAFDQVLDPVVNLVNSIQSEVKQIDTKINEFEPGTMAAKFLAPYLEPLIEELDRYKPSILLAKVEEIYKTILKKMNALDPNQLLHLLDQLYDKLVDVIKALSPEELTKFIKQKLGEISTALDGIPIEQLVNKVIDSIGDVEKILGGLGLDSVLKSDFWKTLEEVLTISIQDKITQIDAIKASVVERVNGIDEAQLKTAIASLRTAIDDANKDFTTIVTTALVSLDNSLQQYQTAITTFEAQWLVQQDILKSLKKDPEYSVDYQDLKKRLTQLHDRLVAVKPIEDQVTQIKAKVQTIAAPPTTGEKSASKPVIILTATDAKVLLAFKQAIPKEIERELTGPITKMLNTLDQILAKPRKVLDSVKAVIKQLAAAPKELAKILKQLASSLGTVVRGAIDRVKTVIRTFDVNFLNNIHAKIVTKLEEFSPILVLNAFYAPNDFVGSDPNKLLQHLRDATPEDKVSAYFLSQLDQGQKTLLASSDSPGAQKALMQSLNTLLKDAKFYSSDRFTALTLPKEARDLITLDSRTMKQTVRLNRLLLEAAYPKAIPMSMQSIYPFFLEKLRSLYPTEIVEKLDDLHTNIKQIIQNFPKALAGALNDEYQKVVNVCEAIQALINKIFLALIERLRGLQSELGIGLEDVSDAYNKLLVALPL